MRILFITHRCPYPPNRGDSIRSYRLLKLFASMGSVSLATLCDGHPEDHPDAKRVLGGMCRHLVMERWGGPRKWLRAALTFGFGRTLTEGLFRSPRLASKIRTLTWENDYDLVVVYCSSMAPYLRTLASRRRPRVVVDLVDVDSQKWFDYAERARGWKRWVFRAEGRRLRQLERQIARDSDLQLVVTPEEAQLYRSFAPEANVHPAPNGVDTAYFDPEAVPDTGELERRCVFVGALDYRANVDGVEWFAAEALPRLRERFPDCEFDVVGSRPGNGLAALAKNTPGMNLVGTVPDVRPYLSRSSVVVAPLRVARGLQNKVLEACAMSRAVVVSPGAAEGIERGEFRDAFRVCDATEEWLDAISGWFTSATSRREAGRTGRAMVLAHYGWEARLGHVRNLLEQLPGMESESERKQEQA